MNIVIADICFLIRCKELPVRRGHWKTYEPFIMDPVPAHAGLVSIQVNLEIGSFPPLDRATRIFETPEAWSLFREGEEYFWIDVPASSGRAPDCLARFRRCPERVVVYCGQDLITEAGGNKSVQNPISYPLDQVLLMYALADRGGIFMHASAVESNGKGYIFPGRSGAGKSTISRFFAATGYNLLSDDRIVVRKINGDFYAFGTPWAGDAGIAENRRLPLGGIFFLSQSSENRIQKLTPAEAVERLMPVSSVPWFDKQAVPGILSFCEDLVLHVPAYDIFFKPDIGVVKLFEQFISG